jgi:CheY-like chemotaxis protein/nitrogen-specific signal transduction histidine kinase
MNLRDNRRILVVDDNPAIHNDFKKILGESSASGGSVQAAKAAFFGKETAEPAMAGFDIESAYQGDEALDIVRRSADTASTFAMAFVDVRMPPGLDGVETIARLWTIDPDVQCVICTAYADYSWQSMIDKLGVSDRLLILKKPFDPIEVRQIAMSLTEKWNATRRDRQRMTEVERAEKEARAYSSSLVTVNRALETAKAGAEALARFRSEFLLGISHEIRVPTMLILGGAEALENPGLEEAERAQEVVAIHDSGRRLLTILDDVHELAKIENGAMHVEIKACSPATIVDEAVQAWQGAAEEKHVRLAHRSTQPAPDLIESDPVRLRRILTNLIGAALRMTSSDSITVSMRMQRDEEWDEPHLEILVETSGISISHTELGRLFEAAPEHDASAVLPGGASRLGLALAKRLSRLLGGDITVESTPGKGTRFAVSVRTGDVSDIRMVVADPPAALPASAPLSETRMRARPLLHGRVLVVEDNRTTQHMLTHMLVGAGAEVALAENGEVGRDKALEALSTNHPFDLVLMDMQMPRMDGHTATRELRAQGYRGPIVAVTAHCLTGDREKCIDAGCDDFIAKPIERASFIAACEKWMKPTAPSSPLPAPRVEEGAPSEADESAKP